MLLLFLQWRCYQYIKVSLNWSIHYQYLLYAVSRGTRTHPSWPWARREAGYVINSIFTSLLLPFWPLFADWGWFLVLTASNKWLRWASSACCVCFLGPSFSGSILLLRLMFCFGCFIFYSIFPAAPVVFFIAKYLLSLFQTTSLSSFPPCETSFPALTCLTCVWLPQTLSGIQA